MNHEQIMWIPYKPFELVSTPIGQNYPFIELVFDFEW